MEAGRRSSQDGRSTARRRRAHRLLRALLPSALVVVIATACDASPRPARHVIELATRIAGAEKLPGGHAAMAPARAALDRGAPHLALARYVEARLDLGGQAYGGEHKAASESPAAFDQEWRRAGTVLAADLRPPRDGERAFAGTEPALARALAEAASAQVAGYYRASLDYGHATGAPSGLYYLGQATAAAAVTRELRDAAPAEGEAPALRSLAPDLALLQSAMLRAYKPPLSIDDHPQFIAASARLKEARELERSGLRAGALLRYLQAAANFAPLVPPASPVDVDAELRRWDARLGAQHGDASIGRLFLESARSAHDDRTADGDRLAAGIVSSVLPRYEAALGPAPPLPPAGTPQVTVTLVRWPYT